MRVLSVRQPWTWALVYGGKDVENRTRNLAGSYRGPVAIHASLTDDDAAYEDDLIRDALSGEDDSWMTEARMESGVIHGVVDLLDVHEDGPGCCSSRWAQRGVWHLRVGNARPIEWPIPAKGKLGLWTPDAALLGRIREQVAS